MIVFVCFCQLTIQGKKREVCIFLNVKDNTIGWFDPACYITIIIGKYIYSVSFELSIQISNNF